MNKLGPMLEQFGSGLRDLAIAGMGVQFNGTGNIPKLHLWLIVGGSIISLAGKSIGAAYRTKEVKLAIAGQDEKIAQIANDTAQFKK